MPLARLIVLVCLITAAPPLLAADEIVDALDASFSCLSVDAPVSGARVILDGGLIGSTPLHLALAPAGLHRIAVVAEEQGICHHVTRGSGGGLRRRGQNHAQRQHSHKT